MWSRRRALGLFLVLGLGLAACSGTTGGDACCEAEPPGTATPETPAAPPPPDPGTPPPVPPPTQQPPVAQTPPPDGLPCSPTQDVCTAGVHQAGVCRPGPLPDGTACNALGSGEIGRCRAGTCDTDGAPYAWAWAAPEPRAWPVAPVAGTRDVLVWSMPRTATGRCTLSLVAAGDVVRARTLYDGEGMCRPVVLHGRWAAVLDTSAAPSLRVVRLQDGAAVRRVDLSATLQAMAGVNAGSLRLVQGPAGAAWLLAPGSERSWAALVDLETLQAGAPVSVSGVLRSPSVADEAGTAYLHLSRSGRTDLVALGADGKTLWSRSGAATPRAVFDGTLFLDDGRVLDTATGEERYRHAVTGAQVLLDASHAVLVASCSTSCYRVTVLDRRTGAQRASESVRSATLPSMFLTAGGVYVLGLNVRPDLSASPAALVWDVVPYELRAEGAGRWGQSFVFWSAGQSLGGEAVLVPGMVLAQRTTPASGESTPTVDFLGVRAAGVTPSERGWLTWQGAGTGTFGPR